MIEGLKRHKLGKHEAGYAAKELAAALSSTQQASIPASVWTSTRIGTAMELV
jgi:hypothetical protein